MAYALETHQLGKRYRTHWALRNCTLQIPQGSIAGLVGLNGAGKTTLLHLTVGLLRPDEGTLQVLGRSPQGDATLLPRLGFVSQERSLYRFLSVADTLTMGQKLNTRWDVEYAHSLIERLHLPYKQSVGKLSGGQQVQLALIMALAKRPEILFLDEPFAQVDMLARHEILKILMEMAVEHTVTILVSSHLVSDLENICDYFIILTPAQVQLAESMEHIKEQHRRIIGPREHFEAIAETCTVIQASHTGRQSMALVRSPHPIQNLDWQVEDVSLEEIALAYLAMQEKSQTNQRPAELMKEVSL